MTFVAIFTLERRIVGMKHTETLAAEGSRRHFLGTVGKSMLMVAGVAGLLSGRSKAEAAPKGMVVGKEVDGPTVKPGTTYAPIHS